MQTKPIQSKYKKNGWKKYFNFFVLSRVTKEGKKEENCEREKGITTEKHTENMHKQ